LPSASAARPGQAHPSLTRPPASSPAPAQAGTNGPWKQVWSDEFNGQAGGGIDTRSWKFDTGQGVFGTDEVETMTSALPVSGFRSVCAQRAVNDVGHQRLPIVA